MATFTSMRARGFGHRLDPLLAAQRPLRHLPRPTARRVLKLLYTIDLANPDAVTFGQYRVCRALAALPWIRPFVGTEVCPDGSLRPLLEHLLVDVHYPLPGWLWRIASGPVEPAWPVQVTAIQLLAHLGTGGRLRGWPGLPPLTRRAGHLLWTEGEGTTVLEAAQRAHLRAMGVDRSVEDALVDQAVQFVHWRTPWWRAAFRWVVDRGFTPAEVPLVVRWLRSRHRQDDAVPQVGRRRALQLAEAHTRGWHQPMPPESGLPPVPLQAPLRLGRWTLVQLRTAGEVVAEGNAMRHCVATYVPQAMAGACSLWSFRLDDERRLTVELSHEGVIVQAKGLENRAPVSAERIALTLLARAAGWRLGL